MQQPDERAVTAPKEPANTDPRLVIHSWTCACGMKWEGVMGSVAYEAYQSHIRRHFHARLNTGRTPGSGK